MAYFASRYFGLKAYGKIFGLMFGFFLVGTGVGPYLNALSYDRLHAYEPALIVSCLCALGACLLFAALGPYPFSSQGGAANPLKPAVVPGTALPAGSAVRQ